MLMTQSVKEVFTMPETTADKVGFQINENITKCNGFETNRKGGENLLSKIKTSSGYEFFYVGIRLDENKKQETWHITPWKYI